MLMLHKGRVSSRVGIVTHRYTYYRRVPKTRTWGIKLIRYNPSTNSRPSGDIIKTPTYGTGYTVPTVPVQYRTVPYKHGHSSVIILDGKNIF